MHSQKLNSLALGLWSTLLVPADAYWRMPCPGTLVTERLDPIVAPGKVSGHSHIVLGGNAFATTMDYSTTQKSTCTSCNIDGDFSNYWVPNLYYAAENGSFTSVDIVGGQGGTVYYFQDRATYPGKTVKEFPQGFRMTAGNPEARTSSTSLNATQITHKCINYNAPDIKEQETFPTQNCPEGIRTQVFFPSCWDGVNLDTPNHQAHMAYPSGGNSGTCPDSHPNPTVSIFFEFLWDTGKFANDWYGGKQPFVLSMGDSTGYGFHGDFIMGWQPGLLQKGIDTCTSNDAGIADNVYACSVFKAPSTAPDSCSIPAIVKEQVLGQLPALPGCNPVTNTPTAITDCTATTSFGLDTSQYYTDMTSDGWAYLGCGTDNYYTRALTGPNEDIPTMTVKTCMDFCGGKGYSLAGLEYGSQCYCGNSMPAGASPIPGALGSCNMACAGNSKEKCGDASKLSLYQKCGSTCVNAVLGLSGSVPTAAASKDKVVAPVAGSSSAATKATSLPVDKAVQSVVSPTSSTVVVAPVPKATSSTTVAKPYNPIATASSKSSAAAPAKTSPATANPGTSSGGATNVTLPAGWKSAGCYSDALNPRSLSGETMAWWGELITSSNCVAHCHGEGWKYAGTENSGQCFCGNSLVQSKVVDDKLCNMKCEGNKNGQEETCGGAGTLSIFTSASSSRRRSHKHRHIYRDVEMAS